MPTPLPYSPIRTAGNLVFTAGQIGRDPDSGIAPQGIEKQTQQMMDNLIMHLKNTGCSINDVLKTTVYLTSMDDYAAFNDVYASYFTEPYPARTCIAVSELPRVADVGLLVEIEAVAQVRQ